MSSGFCVPQLLKLVFFHFIEEKMKRVHRIFLQRNFVLFYVCDSLFRCRYVPLLAANPGDAADEALTVATRTP